MNAEPSTPVKDDTAQQDVELTPSRHTLTSSIRRRSGQFVRSVRSRLHLKTDDGLPSSPPTYEDGPRSPEHQRKKKTFGRGGLSLSKKHCCDSSITGASAVQEAATLTHTDMAAAPSSPGSGANSPIVGYDAFISGTEIPVLDVETNFGGESIWREKSEQAIYGTAINPVG